MRGTKGTLIPMRPLVLAASVALLAGCSLPYEGTSFKANPELEASLRGRAKKEEGHEGAEHKAEDKHETNADGEGERKIGIANRMYTGDMDSEAHEKSPMDQTGVAFPPTAQPGE